MSTSQTRRAAIVVNATGGTLRTMDADSFGAEVADAFRDAGYNSAIHVVPGDKLIETLENAARSDDVDAVIACGGDGTISAAAGFCWRHGKVLGVLPGGTMNLFARAVGLPMDLHAAVPALAGGTVIDGDIATANGDPFVHQISVGLQPRIVSQREQFEFRSRAGKMLASMRAILDSFTRPPRFHAVIETAGGTERGSFNLIAVSNNQHGEGHLPYADRVDSGELGLYRARNLSSADMARLTGDLVLGTWGNNEDFEAGSGGVRVVLRFDRLKRGAQAVIDGELIDLKAEMEILLHPGELKLLQPASTAAS